MVYNGIVWYNNYNGISVSLLPYLQGALFFVRINAMGRRGKASAWACARSSPPCDLAYSPALGGKKLVKYGWHWWNNHEKATNIYKNEVRLVKYGWDSGFEASLGGLIRCRTGLFASCRGAILHIGLGDTKWGPSSVAKLIYSRHDYSWWDS